jgi:hypothetical protein
MRHPSLDFVRYSAAAFIAAVAKNLSTIDRHCSLAPLLEASTRRALTLPDQETVLLSALKKPMPRQLYQAIISCRDIELLYDALLLRKMSRERSGPTVKRTQEVSKKQSEIFAMLMKNGLSVENEPLILRLEAYVPTLPVEPISPAGALPNW